MKQVFIKELSAFTTKGLAEKLGVSVERAAQCIEMLTTRGVLRLRSGVDENEFDTVECSAYRGKYQFNYVGLSIIGDEAQRSGEGLTIVVYPKYLDQDDYEQGPLSVQSRERLRQIFRVLRKSSGSYSDIATLTEETRRFNDRIACMLMLMEMYAEYGVYSNYVKTLHLNGSGNIAWERTISRHQPHVQNNIPVYFDYETIVNTKDDADFIMRMHRCVLTECSKYMRECGVAEILGLDDIELSDERLDDLGDTDHLLYRLDRERSVQYVTWKQDVIDLMKRYVNKDSMIVSSDRVICLGTTSFYHVWEEACKVALGDQIDKPVNKLGLSRRDGGEEISRIKLIDTIPHPQWSICGIDSDGPIETETFIPDTVALRQDPDGKVVFGIFDAKYYVPTIKGSSIVGQPGLESVTKQVLYQQAFRKFILDHKIDRVANAFVTPSNDDSVTHIGTVSFPGVFAPEQPPFVDGVAMWGLPAETVWRCYLNGQQLPNTELATIFEDGAITS